jgi:RNA polymerase sigma-70 factor (ECF subfamily)
MDDTSGLPDTGTFETRYLAFLETVTYLRPSLHRYCTRMTGSVSDGEDIVQEALFHVYRKLDTYDDTRPLKPWLFQIAHNRCIDFLRRRGVREQAEVDVEAGMPASFTPDVPVGPEFGRAVEHLVLTLPPKERACVLLKDVLDYSLEEIAELVGTTVGGAKSALNRGRTKLAAAVSSERLPARRPVDAEQKRLRDLYVERFNRRDWTGLRDLIAADARVLVADRFAGPFADAPYFGNYDRMTTPWRMVAGEVDGEPAVISMRRAADGWAPHSIVRLQVAGGRIVRITDFAHCPWVLPAAASVLIPETTQGDPI